MRQPLWPSRLCWRSARSRHCGPINSKGTVGGPTADIDDQHPFFFIEGRFEIEPGGNRFKLEDHIAETGAESRPLKDPLRLGVRVVAAEALEVNRSANHRLVDLLGQLAFGLQFDVQHHGADQVFKQGPPAAASSPLAPRKDLAI